MKRTIVFALIFSLIVINCGDAVAGRDFSAPFMLRFIDAADGRPIPLVELEAFHALRLVSDNAGYIAVQEPEFTHKRIRFIVRGNGYEYEQSDFFGEKAINPEIIPGHTLQIKLRRNALARRLYRITGAGRYRDSVLGGVASPESGCNLPGNVIGLDSAIPVWWRNKLHCFWGDTLCTDRLNLSGSGGIVRFSPADDDFVPPDIEFFTDKDGYAQPMIDTGSPGFVWIEAVLPFRLPNGSEVLVARYVKHKTLEEAIETGFAIFRPLAKTFSVVKKIPSSRHHKSAHAVSVSLKGRVGFAIQPWEISLGGLSGFMNPDSYSAFSCLIPATADEGFAIDHKYYRVNRDEAGRIRYAWVPGGLACNPRLQTQLCAMNVLEKDERWLFLTDMETGKESVDFSGSVSWNNFKQRWIMIAQGDTGEIWYSEADTFTGPWIYARPVVRHDCYNFYNPVHHVWLDKNDGSTVLFEGTYTAFFTRDGYKTPRADYNQVMYSLDLSQPKLLLPEPIYCIIDDGGGRRLMSSSAVKEQKLFDRVSHIEFCAFSRNTGFENVLKAVYDHSSGNSEKFDLQTEPNGGKPLFYVIPDDLAAAELGISLDLLQPTGYGKTLKAKVNRAVTCSPDIEAAQSK